MYNNKYRHKIIFWKKVGGEKCNPKKIFYEFFKLFRKQKDFSSAELLKKPEEEKSFENPKPGRIKNLNTHNSCVW